MKIRQLISIIRILMLLSYISCIGQSNSNVKFNNHEKILYDKKIKEIVEVKGVIRVYFKDSINLEPLKTEIIILKFITPMASSNCSTNFSYLYSKKNKLNKFQWKIKEEYSYKIDSIFKAGNYEFENKKNNWVVNRKLDFTFFYKILPK
ncbi:hypothetical protein QQY79_08290 [Flavobacterium tructae]|uniref:hypothetical protein n=1 Tax=Flavobacterium tructae TaxID=1114873 RepID=UPI002551F046|nr:hypothetical protein [Flavobacterium tructae]MDL2142515.1 hypothetical protein [Flavobacterium tructae]